MTTLAEYADINPAVSALDRTSSALVAFVPMAAVSEDGRLVRQEKRPIAEVAKGYTYFEKNDVLMAKITPCMENGKAALLDSLETDRGFGSTEFHVLRPRPGIDRRFLFYLVWNERFRNEAAKHMTGSAGQKRVPSAYLAKAKVRWVDPHEQRRIADVLDKADTIRRNRKQAIALTGDLLRSTFVDRFGDIPAKRSRWPFLALRPYLSTSSGKSSKSILSATKTTIPVYGGNGVNGWASEALYTEPVVVVGRVGQQCGITRMTDGPAWVTDNAIVVSITRPDVLNPVYLMTALQHSPLRASVMRLDLPFINQSTILDYPLPLPPLDVQNRFAELSDSLRRAQTRLTAGSDAAEQLFGSLVQRMLEPPRV